VNRIVGITVALVALAMAGSSASAEPGLVGRWHLNEGSGTIAADSAGHENNGTVMGSAQWVPGAFGSALSFDGSMARVLVVNTVSLEPASAVSVSAWVNHAGSPGRYRYILAKGATGCVAASYALYSGPRGGLDFYVSDNRGTSFVLSPDAGTQVWDGNRHLVVGTFDGSVLRLFVDGNEVGSGTPHTRPIGYNLTDSNDLFIGDYPGCTVHAFIGVIDEVMVWSRALSRAEVSVVTTQAAQRPEAVGVQTPVPSDQPVSAPGGDNLAPGGPQGTRSAPPSLGHLRLSPPAFATASKGRSLAGDRIAGTTITYTDTQAATTTFTVVRGQPGVAQGGRCVVKPRARGRGTYARRCIRYTALASFRVTDSAGRNRFRFTGIRGRKLGPGRYRLTATPSAHGQTGRTVSAAFTIKA
jgi:hypothetical protein